MWYPTSMSLRPLVRLRPPLGTRSVGTLGLGTLLQHVVTKVQEHQIVSFTEGADGYTVVG